MTHSHAMGYQENDTMLGGGYSRKHRGRASLVSRPRNGPPVHRSALDERGGGRRRSGSRGAVPHYSSTLLSHARCKRSRRSKQQELSVMTSHRITKQAQMPRRGSGGDENREKLRHTAG